MTKQLKSVFMVAIVVVAIAPVASLANGGDQRLVERGKYFINLSSAPFTPHVGVKTSFIASFFDVTANRLINEDLLVSIRISKPGNTPRGNFIFDRENIVVKGGILEFPYTFSEAVLHEIFFDFAFALNPERMYNAPDFLIDVQKPSNGYNKNQLFRTIFGSFIAGLIVGWFIKRGVRNRVG